MKDIVIDATSDWHVGNPNPDKEFPTLDEIRTSLDDALKRKVDAYIVAGDFIDRGNVESAQIVADTIRPFTAQGLLVIGIVGNHDFIDGSKDMATSLLTNAGVKMLEGQSCVVASKTGDKKITVLGVSSEIGPEYDNWWRVDGWNSEGRVLAHEKAAFHRRALEKGLAESSTETVLLVTHRSMIPDVIGTKARETNYIPAHTEGFANIIDKFASSRTILSVVGHHHGTYPWEGYLYGTTPRGVEVFNVAAPVRRRHSMKLAKTFTF